MSSKGELNRPLWDGDDENVSLSGRLWDAAARIRSLTRSQNHTDADHSLPLHRQPILPHVLHDLSERVRGGAKLYGEPLTSLNGRDALWDAYEEALDLALYLRQCIAERQPGFSVNPNPPSHEPVRPKPPRKPA